MITTLLIILVLVLMGYIVKSVTKPKKYPPGPKWYPFIGCSNIVRRMTEKHGSQFKGLLELSKQYSTQVLGLKLGGELIIVVYGEKNVRQVFTEKEFEGRPTSFFIKLRCLGKKMGITFADGPLWREHRQFTVKQLRNVGFGKTLMEKEIQNEMFSITDYIARNNYNPLNPKSIFAASVMNVLWKYVAGEKIEEDKLKLLLELMTTRSKAFSIAGGLLNQFPWCRFVVPEWSGYNLIRKINKQISEIIEEAVQRHKDNVVEGNDFIFSFLHEMHDGSKPLFTEEQLTIVCLDLIIAGSQTTSNMLEFAVLVLLRNRGIQEKIYNEINRTIGDDTPCWNDCHTLVYTSAFLLEVQRYYTITPFAGPRRVLEETVIDGYIIPKDTTVLISVGDIHFNQELWEEPHVFNPERFIDTRGALKNSEHMYPFGLGRRRCPGDSLAKSFVFITLVGILQKYRIECSNGVLPSEEPIIGLIASARPFTVDFTLRS